MGRTCHRQNIYFGEHNKRNAQNHTRMYPAGQAVEYTSHRMYHFPQREVDNPSQGHNIAQLSHFIVGSQHG